MFEAMRKVNPQGLSDIRLEGRRVVAEISGRTLMACSLSDLPAIPEPVLLDIDTDFLMSESHEVARSGMDPRRQLPWLWPEELIRRLREKRVRTDFVTIA